MYFLSTLYFIYSHSYSAENFNLHVKHSAFWGGGNREMFQHVIHNKNKANLKSYFNIHLQLHFNPLQGRTGGVQGRPCFENRFPAIENRISVMRASFSCD